MVLVNSSTVTKIISGDVTAEPGVNYICNSISTITITTPATCKSGYQFLVTGIGAGYWKICPNTNQVLLSVDSAVSSPQVSGSCVVQCITDDSIFKIISYDNVLGLNALTIEYSDDLSVILPNNRGIFTAGGYSSIEYVSIATTSSAYTFGNLSTPCSTSGGGGVANSIRGVIPLSYTTANTSVMDYITISTTGNSSAFGVNTQARQGVTSTSNSIIGLSMGGFTTTAVNTVDSITIATTGNSSAFGSLSSAARYCTAACSSFTRALTAGGDAATAGTSSTSIEYFTIATASNSSTHSSLSQARRSFGGCSSGIRGYFSGGCTYEGATSYNIIDVVTIASTGSATDFGDLLSAKYGLGSCSSTVTGLVAGGTVSTTAIVYFNLESTGSCTNFGSLSTGRYYISSISNCHGGLV